MTGGLSPDASEITVEARAHGWRVDHYLTRLYPNYSRALLQRAIEQHGVLVNGLPVKSSRRLRVNDRISIRLPELPDESVRPENIPLEILYEDDYFAVINKPANMVVHPGRGNYQGTLAAALQFHFDQLSDTAGKLRPGIVHRLDRDTTGVVIIAKDNQVHHLLSRQFERREVQKEYRALVWRKVELDSDVIETHMRVNPKRREKMMVCPPGNNAREATTSYEVLERFDGFTYVRLLPKTGRTHQLRVHMNHLGHPIVADRLYGGRDALHLSELISRETLPAKRKKKHRAPQFAEPIADSESSTGESSSENTEDILILRQALHALRLTFKHPQSGQPLQFEAPLPNDFENALQALRTYRAE